MHGNRATPSDGVGPDLRLRLRVNHKPSKRVIRKFEMRDAGKRGIKVP